jgi:hypothetical protein
VALSGDITGRYGDITGISPHPDAVLFLFFFPSTRSTLETLPKDGGRNKKAFTYSEKKARKQPEVPLLRGALG